MTITFLSQQADPLWGCAYQEAVSSIGTTNIKLCFVEVQNIHAFATALISLVHDKSWMTNLDDTARRSFEKTVTKTADKLVATFQKAATAGTVGAAFGEVMVSIGSARALENLFQHLRIPLAELWKPKLSQNGGFDFHTICTSKVINFGEAKYSSSTNSYAAAIDQADEFLDDEKHLADSIYLEKIVGQGSISISMLNNDEFGVVAAFSVNAKNPALILANAFESAKKVMGAKKIKNFYLVGVR